MLYVIHAEDKRTDKPEEPKSESAQRLAQASEKFREIKRQLEHPRHRVTDPQ